MRIKSNKKGFTLIELLITIAIIGVITAFALPSYTEYVRKARRSDARVVLLQSAQFMERFLTENDRYDFKRDGATAVALPLIVSPAGATGSQVMYDITISAVTRSTYTLNATPKSGNAMAGDACGTYTVNSLGAKGNASNTYATDICWLR